MSPDWGGHSSLVTHHPSPITQALDWQAVGRGTAGQIVGRRFVYLEAVSSTDDVARRLAAAGEAEGVAVFAETQTAGRGRAGKSPWLTPPYTSVALSVLLRPALAPADLPQLAMLAGVAAVEAIRGATGVAAALKWPNDVVVSERKVGGILVESAVAGGRVGHVTLGIGINGNFAAADLGPLPDAAVAPTTLQDEAGRPIGREALLIGLLQALDRQYATLRGGAAASIWQRYRDCLSTLGQPVHVQADVAVDGIAEAVTPQGALIVRLAGGARRTFAYGEVSVRTPIA